MPIRADVGQRFINCILEVIARQGALDFTIDKSTTNGSLPLNTSNWCKASPKLCSMYPDAPVSMHAGMSPTMQPSINCTAAGNGKCILLYPLRLNVSAYDPAGTRHYVFTVGFDINVGLNLHIVEPAPGNGTLHVNVTDVKATAKVYDDNQCPVSVAGLQVKAVFVAGLAKVAINAALAGGIPLPKIGPVSLTQAQVYMSEGFISIAADLLFPQIARQAVVIV